VTVPPLFAELDPLSALEELWSLLSLFESAVLPWLELSVLVFVLLFCPELSVLPLPWFELSVLPWFELSVLLSLSLLSMVDVLPLLAAALLPDGDPPYSEPG